MPTLIHKRTLVFGILLFIFLFCRPALAHADSMGLIFRGVAKTLFSAFQIPAAIVHDSTQVLFPFGILTGTVSGAYRTVTGTLSGAIDIARGAAPYAKYMVFL